MRGILDVPNCEQSEAAQRNLAMLTHPGKVITRLGVTFWIDVLEYEWRRVRSLLHRIFCMSAFGLVNT